MTDYWTEFARESDEHITSLNNSLLTLEQNPNDEEAMESIFRTAHTLKGNCGAMGLKRASDLAHAIEDLLEAIRGDEIEITSDVMDVIFDGVDELEAMLDEAAATGEIDSDPGATIESLRSPLEGRSAGSQQPIREPTVEEIETVLARFDPPSDIEGNVYLVRLSVVEHESVNNGQLVVEALIDAFDLIGTEPSQEVIENDQYGTRFDAVFASAVGKAAISAALDPVDAVEEFVIVDVTEQVTALEASPAPAPAPDVDDSDEDSLSEGDPQDLSVDELLDEFEEFDDLDAMVEDVDESELEAFDDMGDAGSFDDLLGETADEPEIPEPAKVDDVDEPEPVDVEADSHEPIEADGDEVDDASAVFAELKDEVEMVGFDELQSELDELEFDEFDSEEEVDMDELLGDDVDTADNSFLGVREDPLNMAESSIETDPQPDLQADDDAAETPVVGDEDASSDGVLDDVLESDEVGDEEIEPPEDDLVADDEAFGSFADDAFDAEPGDADAEIEEPAENDEEIASVEALEDVDFADTAPEADGEPAITGEDHQADAIDVDVDEVEAVDVDAPDSLEIDEADSLEADSTTIEEAEAFDAGETEAADTESDDEFAPSDSDDEIGLVEEEFDESTDESAFSETEDGFGADEDDFLAFDEGVERFDETESEPSDTFDLGLAESLDDTGDATFDGESEATDTDEATDSAFEDESLDLGADADFADEAGSADDFGATADVLGDDDGQFADVSASTVDIEATQPSDSSAAGFGEDSSSDDEQASRVYEDVPPMPIPEISIPEETEEEKLARADDQRQSVHVDIEQVDTLLNLVEGLVTSRVRLRHTIEQGDDLEAIDRELDDLEDLTSDLQETVMDVRLVPLETVTNRLPRTVRDIARDQGKDVGFRIQGEDVELDRTVLDRMGDPLIHLVRNAVDHGIEGPDHREAVDKPREGTVEVYAERARDQVTIRVEDDGRGIDPEKLRAAALKADILTEDEAESMEDDDVYELIFHPGLSTASEITDVSGRGVGMDVVKRTIEDLDGTVTVDSTPGQGTTVTMQLPVTVAIAEVLFFELGGEEFGIPLKTVQDIDDGRSIEIDNGEPVLSTPANDQISVIDLANTLEVRSDIDLEEGMVIRIRDDVRSVALHCDNVRSQQEVVVKPFEGVMSGIPGLSGATVRGRGEVVNILDVTTL
ncbi:ATP-binding protein [Halobacteria archaeon AArc-curdl1]|uniref:Chemotaxis protein CheA n=1 Tax=Natronosalvus hydrolyticus TaxID=2979988 RepID=A0AAP2Z8X1_9EURY|nr:ATP-binding protein [Halobacteria archaeon AArc-curdl1]